LIATFDSTLIFASGSITDTGGAISFGDENLSTSGTLTSGAATIDSTLALASGSITDSTGTIDFDNENLTTTGTGTFGAGTGDDAITIAEGSYLRIGSTGADPTTSEIRFGDGSNIRIYESDVDKITVHGDEGAILQTAGGSLTLDNSGDIDLGSGNLTTTGTGQFGTTYYAEIGELAGYAGMFSGDGGFVAYLGTGIRAGAFDDGSNSVYLADGTYAINATGNSLFTGNLTTTGTGSFGTTYTAVLGVGGISGTFTDSNNNYVWLADDNYAINAQKGSGIAAAHFTDGVNNVYFFDSSYIYNDGTVTIDSSGNIATTGTGTFGAGTGDDAITIAEGSYLRIGSTAADPTTSETFVKVLLIS